MASQLSKSQMISLFLSTIDGCWNRAEKNPNKPSWGCYKRCRMIQIRLCSWLHSATSMVEEKYVENLQRQRWTSDAKNRLKEPHDTCHCPALGITGISVWRNGTTLEPTRQPSRHVFHMKPCWTSCKRLRKHLIALEQNFFQHWPWQLALFSIDGAKEKPLLLMETASAWSAWKLHRNCSPDMRFSALGTLQLKFIESWQGPLLVHRASSIAALMRGGLKIKTW